MNINFQQPLMLISLQYMSFDYAIKLIFFMNFLLQVSVLVVLKL